MALFDKISEDIKAAMLARQQDKLEALRSIKAAFLVARTSTGATAVLSDDEEMKIIQKLVKQRKDSADIYKAQNRDDLYTKEVFEVEVISQYLPKQMDESEVAEIIKGIIANVGAKAPSDMGKVMGIASKQFAGKADNKVVSDIVKRLLSN